MDTSETSDDKVVFHGDDVLRKKDLIEPNEKIFIGYFGGNSKEHAHDFIELVYVVSGRAKHFHDSVERTVKPGDCFLIDIGSRHRYSESTSDFKLINCLFQPSFLSAAIKDDETFKALACNVFMTVEETGLQGGIFVESSAAPGVHAVLKQMLDEMSEKKTGYLEILQSLLKVALIYIFRGLAPASQPRIIAEIVEYINFACDKKLNVETISESMFFSPAYISRIFKKYTGKNLSDYIRERRMENVAKKLSETDASIDKIIIDAGYSDKKGFYEQFFRFYGCTPGEFRKRNRIRP